MATKTNPHFETILDSIADGVFTIDLDFNITYFNQAAETITGVSKDQALGQKCFDVFRANICQTSCALGKTMQSGKQGINIPVDILNSQGERVSASVSTSKLSDARGHIIGGVEIFRDLTAVEALRKKIDNQYRFEDIVSKNYDIQRIFDILPDIATSGSTILIEGPSGSGKELFARAIHNVSSLQGEFVAVNCAALPDTLLESELFGYRKGAFSEAKKDKPGRFERAAGGTLFVGMGDAVLTVERDGQQSLQTVEELITKNLARVRTAKRRNQMWTLALDGGVWYWKASQQMARRDDAASSSIRLPSHPTPSKLTRTIIFGCPTAHCGAYHQSRTLR